LRYEDLLPAPEPIFILRAIPSQFKGAPALFSMRSRLAGLHFFFPPSDPGRERQSLLHFSCPSLRTLSQVLSDPLDLFLFPTKLVSRLYWPGGQRVFPSLFFGPRPSPETFSVKLQSEMQSSPPLEEGYFCVLCPEWLSACPFSGSPPLLSSSSHIINYYWFLPLVPGREVGDDPMPRVQTTILSLTCREV